MLATRDWIESSLNADTDVKPPDGVYVDGVQLTETLSLCHRSLQETGYGLVAAGRLTDLLRRVSVFGVALARLDIRQVSRCHDGGPVP